MSLQSVGPESFQVLEAALAKAAASLGYQLKEKQESAKAAASLRCLKKEQQESVLHLVSGKDVFVCLPTGYGKSLCYTILPCVFDILRSVEKKSIVLVVSPLIALMKDQVASITAMGITATYVTDKRMTVTSTKGAIDRGDIQVIFISPEALFSGTEWKRLLCTDVYRQNLVAFVVDEAHCIKDWYVTCAWFNTFPDHLHYLSLL